MSGTSWGGALARRTAGQAGADGAWDTDAVQGRLAELSRRRDELTPRFARLSARLDEARDQLTDGLLPEPRLDTELAAARGDFTRLFAEARALADALGIALPSLAGTALPDITLVLDAIRDGLHAELDRQAHWAQARRDAALAVLDRVGRIAYRGPASADGFAPLRTWQARASALGEAIGTPTPPDLHPEVGPLCDGTHPYSHLLDLIDGLATLDEPDYRRLVNTIAADFDEPLARAAGRGLLIADQG